jgi:hypothetical protein
MKKNLLISCSLMILTLLIGVVSTQAQTRGAYDAEIPFDFTIANKNYEAGNYTIRVKSPFYLANILVVTNAKGRDLQTTALARSWDRSKNGQARLEFDRDGDHYFLKQIVAHRFGFWTRKSKEVTTVRIEDGAPNPNTVSIVLKKRDRRIK